MRKILIRFIVGYIKGWAIILQYIGELILDFINDIMDEYEKY